MKTEKQRQKGHISILNHTYVLQIHEKNRIKRETHKNRELAVTILPDVIRHFKGPRMYKSNVNQKKSKKPKKYLLLFTYLSTATVTPTEQNS